MAKILYVEHKFRADALETIEKANAILIEYAAQGYDLTLRQLYYQFVSRGLIANNQREYKALGSIINDARLAGLVDWDHIVDRTRNIRSNSHWDSPASVVEACAEQFQFDKWEDQPVRCEVWIEKDALIGVIERTCRKLDVAFYSCRGYVSQSEIHEAAVDRLTAYERAGQEVHVFHLGDHDPSGIDMSRDIQERLRIFGCGAELHRLALNMPQVDQYSPPPNPAKLTDSRSTSYVRNFGSESWELDALEPAVLDALITKHVDRLIDRKKMRAAVEREKEARRQLQLVAARWDDVVGEIE
jgi:hypothetical protein